MGGMSADLVSAIPADALGGLSADMVAAIPADANFVAPTIGTPGFEQFDTAQASDFVVPEIVQPDFPADFVAPTFDPAVGGFQTEAGGPGLTADAFNDPNFVAPTIGDPGAQGSALDSAFAPAAPVEAAVPSFDPVADTVANVAAADTAQGANQAPEAVVAEAAPEPAPAPEAVVDDAPAPSAPEDPIAG